MNTKIFVGFLIAFALLTDSVRLAAQDPKPDHNAPPAAAATAKPPEAPLSFPFPELAKLDAFTGVWNVVETHFDSLGKPIATVKGTEVVNWQLDQHVLRRTYATTSDAGRFQAIGMLTWSQQLKHYTGHWFDNRSLGGPALAKGEWQETGRTIIFALESVGPDGQKTQYKVIERFEDDDHRVATTYQISSQDMTKRLEVRYERTGPCPAASGIRVMGLPGQE